MKEEWKDIPGYEGLYKVSNLGRVKSLDRKIIYINEVIHFTKGIYLRGHINTHGYKMVILCDKNRKKRIHGIHRLVALVFITNSENKPQVNHIDGDKTNNHVSNLEWCTPAENTRHAFENNLRISPKGENAFNAKKVIDTKTNHIYYSIKHAAEVCKINRYTLSGYLTGIRTNKTTLKYYDND